ncbi:FAD-dependent oxidoreductase [Streptomyces sp. NPDC048518]|uniref:NAD(P)/FAD-dependent oxidoreductase n=1 Tax=Streptomyces sp. NPDC048518 TaxID=3155029 RepID=UPI0033CB3EDB
MTSSAQPPTTGTAPAPESHPGEAARVVVIGAGLAGARLAQRLGEGTVLIGEEEHSPYNRVLLAEVLAGRYGPEVIALPRPRGPVLRTRAVRVDRIERRVLCADGTVVPYTTLVLATGSNPVLPPLRGLFAPGAGELPGGVHAFRTMDDCLALSAAVAEGVRVVVIGGGLLGVSAARALACRGAQVVLVQQAERLMERQLDPASSELVRRHLTGLGVEVHTECRVRGVRVADGAVRGVVLADGYLLETELTVVACGVRPRTGLARAAGLDVRRGVVVDDLLRTSDPHIRAVGDCAEHDGRVYGLATPAVEQADALADALIRDAADGGAAGRNVPGADAASRHLAGRDDTSQGDTSRDDTSRDDTSRDDAGQVPPTQSSPTSSSPTQPSPAQNSAVQSSADQSSPTRPYTGTRTLTRLTLPGPGPLDLAAFGDPEPRPDDDVVQLTDATRGTYRKVVVRDGRLVGGVLLGELAAVGALARAWEADDPLPDDDSPLLHLLAPDGGR